MIMITFNSFATLFFLVTLYCLLLILLINYYTSQISIVPYMIHFFILLHLFLVLNLSFSLFLLTLSIFSMVLILFCPLELSFEVVLSGKYVCIFCISLTSSKVIIFFALVVRPMEKVRWGPDICLSQHVGRASIQCRRKTWGLWCYHQLLLYFHTGSILHSAFFSNTGQRKVWKKRLTKRICSLFSDCLLWH